MVQVHHDEGVAVRQEAGAVQPAKVRSE